MKVYRPSSIELKLAKLSFGHKQRTDFYNQLISLLDTGMSQTDAIQMCWAVASLEGKKPKETLAIVLQDIIQRKKNGGSLGQAIKPWVPTEDVMVFEAIENSDDFVANLRTYMVMLEKKKKIKATIVGGIIYPIMLIAGVIAIMTYFGTSIVPVIGQILPIEDWYGPAIFLRFMNDFAMNYVTPTVIGLIGFLSAIMISLPRWAAGGRIVADRFPIYSTYRMYTGISFLMSMASLIQGGMTATQAIERLRPQAVPYVAYRLTKVRNQLLEGNNLGAALHKAKTGWPDQTMNLNIKIYAETQDLSAQLSKLSMGWIDEAQHNISSTMGLIRNIAMIAVAATLLGIVGGVFSLQTQISNGAM